MESQVGNYLFFFNKKLWVRANTKALQVDLEYPPKKKNTMIIHDLQATKRNPEF